MLFLCTEQERKENSPKYQAWLSEQRALELFAEEEEARLSAERNAAWLAEEERAQKAWIERQERLKLARAERAKQEVLSIVHQCFPLRITFYYDAKPSDILFPVTHKGRMGGRAAQT